MNRHQYMFHRIRSVRFRILLVCGLVLVFLSSCGDLTSSSPDRNGDYWPLKVGNSWTFSYYYTFFNNNEPYFPAGAYDGDLVWEVTGSAVFQDSSTFLIKQKFIGIASEIRQQNIPPYRYDTTYTVLDTSSTFELTMKNGLLKISKNAPTALWGNTFLLSLFEIADVHRYPVSPSTNDSLSYGRNVNQYATYWITLQTSGGPVRIECRWGYVHSTKRATAELKSRVVSN